MSEGRVLVTGAAGFLARHLIQQLVAREQDVVAVVRPGGSRLDTAWNGRLRSVEADLCSSPMPAEALQGVRTVYHLAGRYLPGNSAEALEELRSVNVKATGRVIAACLESGVGRLIHVSSIAACESSPLDVVTETLGEPASAYGQSKHEGEELVRAIAPGRLAWTILRPTAVYGEHGSGTIAEMTRAIQRKTFAMLGDGSNPVNFSYAGNVAAAMIWAAHSPDAAGKTYIIADEPLTLAELESEIREGLRAPGRSMRIPVWLGYGVGALFDAMALFTGGKLPLSTARVRAATARRVYSGEKFKQETRFVAPFAQRDAIRRTAQWHREQGAAASF